MPKYKIIDTFPWFLQDWEHAITQPLETQVELWLDEYRLRWPELTAKQERNYADSGLDWRTVLKERVFPFLTERLPLMGEARARILPSIKLIYPKAQSALGLDFDVIFVILAIGDAGWATSYEGTPACLFGLDTIVECGWSQRETLSGLAAHELGHLVHLQWRERCGLAVGQGPFWQLYEEGFAQRCEHIIMGKYTWHMQRGQKEWLAWCHAHKSRLATQFLMTMEGGEPVYPFFGSWPEYNVCGQRQCGYFLGHEIFLEWEKQTEAADIGLMSPHEVDSRVTEALQAMASEVD